MAKVLGFSAGGCGRDGNVDRMVKALLDKSGQESEFVKLTDLTYSGCKGCVNLCAKPQCCTMEDDLKPWYEKILEADALVIGAPVYFDAINGMAYSFLERFYGYRHVTIPVAGKPVYVVISGGMELDHAEAQIRRMLGDFFQMEIAGVIRYASQTPPCFRCGRHKECTIGGLYMMMGEAAKDATIQPEMFQQWEDNEEVAAQVESCAAGLAKL
ncbi:MAG: flavodoxin family protein [Planctomycetota bacterium]|jgi:multimeric flavodoxin WrbA